MSSPASDGVTLDERIKAAIERAKKEEDERLSELAKYADKDGDLYVGEEFDDGPKSN